VLEEAAAARIAPSALRARARRLGRGAGGRRSTSRPRTAACATIVLGAHDTLRSRGGEPRASAIPPSARARAPAPRRARDAAARGTGAGERDASRGARALAACERVRSRPRRAVAGDLDAAKLGAARRRSTRERARPTATAWTAYRGRAPTTTPRRRSAARRLLDAFAAEYAEARRARAAVDFEDLELGVRDLLADDAERRRWSERFALLMVDEFQDTNRLQLDLLEALERGNLFAVGDEFQSIYRFRHADVEIFRERRAKLEAARVRGLRANFRSAPELLDVLDAAFAPVFGEAFQPLVAGRPREAAPTAADDGELRLFDPDPPAGAPPVELLVTDTKGWDEHAGELGLGALAEQPWRRAEARWVAHRLREEVRAGRRPGDVVVLVRATASLRLFEQALEEQGLPTYVVGGRGYWSQEQVRDGLAYLAALANPRDETAFYGVLASPFCGAGSDALVLLAQAGREGARGPWAALRDAAAGDGAAGWLGAVPPADRDRLLAFAAFFAGERSRAERLPVEVLLERAIAATGYDLAVLARAGGERRLANLRKLMRLAREYERAEGRDLRGFLAYAVGQDLGPAREGEAPLESEGLDAMRLMTIHRAKGLEFPVVCVADLGRPTGVQPSGC
jgi:ATP-dependent exoDNAse (exonuclease V) beta subunit